MSILLSTYLFISAISHLSYSFVIGLIITSSYTVFSDILLFTFSLIVPFFYPLPAVQCILLLIHSSLYPPTLLSVNFPFYLPFLVYFHPFILYLGLLFHFDLSTHPFLFTFFSYISILSSCICIPFFTFLPPTDILSGDVICFLYWLVLFCPCASSAGVGKINERNQTFDHKCIYNREEK